MRAFALLAVLAACGTDGPDTCPSWGPTYMRASGTLSVHSPEASVDDWLVAVEANAGVPGAHTVSVRACKAEYDDNDQPWEPWTFSALWRLEGPVASPIMIPGATLVGVPGMSGGYSHKDLSASLGMWLFMQNGAAELSVDEWEPLAPRFSSHGWVLTDGANAIQVDLDVDLRW